MFRLVSGWHHSWLFDHADSSNWFFVDTGTRQFFSLDARKVFLPDFITAG